MLTFPESHECPSCGTLAYMGDNPDVCAACYLEREEAKRRPQGEVERLFDAPKTMRGQMTLE